MKNKRKKLILTFLLLMLCLLSAFLVILLATGKLNIQHIKDALGEKNTEMSGSSKQDERNQENEEIRKGLAFLDGLDSQDAEAIVKLISDREKEKMREKVFSNPDALWSAFDDSVIVGDSRVVGFYFWEYLMDTRAMADGGAMVSNIPNYVERLEVMHPSNVLLAFGLNDYGCGLWPDPEDYTEVFVENVNRIKEVLPDAKIFVNSTFPAVGVGLYASPAYPRIDEYNKALKVMCEREGYYFIDNDELAAASEDLYDTDGLHFQKEMYPLWAANMLNEVMNS